MRWKIYDSHNNNYNNNILIDTKIFVKYISNNLVEIFKYKMERFKINLKKCLY